MQKVSNELFAKIRFRPESDLIDELSAHYGLDDLTNHLIESGKVLPIHQLVMAQQLRLTPVMAPRLFAILDELRELLDFHDPMDLYVYPEYTINAFALHRLADDKPHIVSITSEMVKSMQDNELRFALAHEIGHLALRHYRALIAHQILSSDESERNDVERKGQLPRSLEIRIGKWQRLSEFSADRVGLHGCGGDLRVAISSFFKISSGLGPEQLNFNYNAFLEQLQDLQQLDRKAILARFSHPVTPVRARALQLYEEGVAVNASEEKLSQIDSEIMKLATLMDFEASTDLGVHARDFFVAGGLLAANADGDISQAEQETLVQLLLQVTGDPEARLAQVDSVDQAEQLLNTSCQWLRENTGQERFTLFGQLAHIVALDGVVTTSEREFMLRVARMMEIPEKSAKDILHLVHSEYARTKAASNAFSFAAGS